jgi:hypothetical protein
MPIGMSIDRQWDFGSYLPCWVNSSDWEFCDSIYIDSPFLTIRKGSRPPEIIATLFLLCGCCVSVLSGALDKDAFRGEAKH